LGFGFGGWGFGVWAPTPNPQSPIPNPQSPIPNKFNNYFEYIINNEIMKFKYY
jgi:hypothetical protein